MFQVMGKNDSPNLDFGICSLPLQNNTRIYTTHIWSEYTPPPKETNALEAAVFRSS